MTTMPILRASRIALPSRDGSTTTMAPGMRSISRMPPRLRVILRSSRLICATSFLVSFCCSMAFSSMASSCARRFSRLRMTLKLVSVPPIQRSVTIGMPVR